MIEDHMTKTRKAIVDAGLRLDMLGLTEGSGGNISVRLPDHAGFLITPSGMAFHDLKSEDLVFMDPDHFSPSGRWNPSSEWLFHKAVYDIRPDVGAVVHTHSVYATTFACLRQPIPALHYMIACAGRQVRVAPYTTFGSEALADVVKEHIQNDGALLLANHGLLAVGADLSSAMAIAETVEWVARLYYQSLAIGIPAILNHDEMDAAMDRFRTYGKQQAAGTT